jgi:OPA family glycerol-6-phosphate transporter-like MFS transporter 4
MLRVNIWLYYHHIQWFKDEQYGTAWSVLSTSMNVAGTLGPLIAAFIITYSSWRYSLLLPGTVLYILLT